MNRLLLIAVLLTGCAAPQRPVKSLAAPIVPTPKMLTIAWQAGYRPHGSSYVQLGWTGLDRSSDLVTWLPETRHLVTGYKQWFTNTVPMTGEAGFFRVIEGYGYARNN